MDKLLKSKFLPLLPIALGGAAVGLRHLVFTLAVDELGLLIPLHPTRVALWSLTALVTLLVIGLTSRMKGTAEYSANFPPSLTGAVGHYVFAGAIVLTVLIEPPEMGGIMGEIWQLTGCVAVAALVWAGLCRLGEKPPSFITHLLVCVFLGFHLVIQYQTWSGRAQVLDFAFSLFAGITLVLFCYYLTAFDVGLGKRRKQLTMGLLSLYLSTVALAESRFWLFYAGAMVWVICDLCALQTKEAQ